MTPALFNWSGGKDSALALWTAREEGVYDVRRLLTTLSSTHNRISMHGVREALLDRQASAIGLPLTKVFLPEEADMETYDALWEASLRNVGAEGIQTALFGDIFLQDLRSYREEALARIGWKGVFPLWERPTADLLLNFIDRGFKAITVCVDGSCLDASFVGRMLDRDFLGDLPYGVDPCGENGEFHSFVFDGPLFLEPVRYHLGEVVHRTYGVDPSFDHGFYFCDLLL